MPRKVYIRPHAFSPRKKRIKRDRGDASQSGHAGVVICLESEDPRLLDTETRRLYDMLAEVNAQMSGPFPLPVRTISGFAGSDTLRRIHRRTLKILRSTPETIGVLERLQLSHHVSITIETAEDEAEVMSLLC